MRNLFPFANEAVGEEAMKTLAVRTFNAQKLNLPVDGLIIFIYYYYVWNDFQK